MTEAERLAASARDVSVRDAAQILRPPDDGLPYLRHDRAAELAQEYGIRDEGGREPPSYREALGAPRVPHPARVM